MTVKYVAHEDVILRESNPYVMHSNHWETSPICSVEQAAEAWEHMQKGPAICKERGHDYSEKVPQTSNMYLCFRCGEPGWEVPTL